MGRLLQVCSVSLVVYLWIMNLFLIWIEIVVTGLLANCKLPAAAPAAPSAPSAPSVVTVTAPGLTVTVVYIYSLVYPLLSYHAHNPNCLENANDPC